MEYIAIVDFFGDHDSCAYRIQATDPDTAHATIHEGFRGEAATIDTITLFTPQDEEWDNLDKAQIVNW